MGSNSVFGGYRLSEFEPADWYVVFHEHSPKWWVRWLARGRFKHVSVFGIVKRSATWVFYDFHLDRARVYAIPDFDADIAIGHFIEGATVVRMARPIGREADVNLRLGWWCVPAVAHILGIRSCALRPDALFRQCLAQGGELV